MRYQFGRNAFRTIEEGLEREWVLGNGIKMGGKVLTLVHQGGCYT